MRNFSINSKMRLKYSIIIIIQLQLIFFQIVFPDSLDENLGFGLNQLTQFDILTESYKGQSEVKQSTDKVFEMVELIGKGLSETFMKKIDLLKKAVEKAEELAKIYNGSDPDSDTIMLANNLSGAHCDLKRRAQFDGEVCLERSAVHIPIDIFAEDKEILKSAAWTSDLDSVWNDNMSDDPGILWQYFGSISGPLRFFPGVQWPSRQKDKDDVDIDLYDVRRRSWYIQGMSLPKEVIVLIDSSGSSQGQAIALMKHITRSILETLNQNDMINSVNFPEEPSRPCFSFSVHATFRNKQRLMDCLKNLTSSGIANFSRGLEVAFSLFGNTTNNNNTNASKPYLTGPHCNRMIVLLTDGGVEKPAEVLRKHNSRRRVRIFSYLVGPISTHAPAIRWIAEKNKGEFYQIPSIVAIRPQTQDYVRYLSESKINLVDDQAFVWTAASLDQLNNNLVISLTVPIFNRSKSNEPSNQTILGVLGLDVSIHELLNSMKDYKFGQSGYVFIINSLGFIIYHPRLEYLREEFLGIDILDLETHPKMKEVRQEMIDGHRGEVKVDDFDDNIDEHHVNIRKRTLRYGPVPGTEFSFCVVLYDDEISDGSMKHLVVEPKSKFDQELFVQVLLSTKNSSSSVALNNKTFCPGVSSDTNQTDLEKFINEVEQDICREDLLNLLYMNIKNTDPTAEAWFRIYNATEVASGVADVLFLFVKTANMFRCFPKKIPKWFEDFFELDYHGYSERIVKSNQWVVTVYRKNFTVGNKTEAILLIGKRLVNENFTVAVMGAFIPESTIRDTVFDSFVESSNNETHTISYLLDDGAIIISTNIANNSNVPYVGKFFGLEWIESRVLEELIEKEIYARHNSTGYLASCQEIEFTDASPRLEFMLPFLQLISPRWWLTTISFHFLRITSVFQTFLSLFQDLVNADVVFYEENNRAETEYCAKDFTKFMFASKSDKPLSANFTCGNCTKLYTTEMLTNANLLLVKVTSIGGCNCSSMATHLPFMPHMNENKEYLQSIFYRKQPVCQPRYNETEETFSGASLYGRGGMRMAFFSLLPLFFLSFMFVLHFNF